MLFSSSKCPLPALVAWCRTLKHSLGAGLSPIRVFKQLGKSGPRVMRPTAKEIAGRLAKGSSLEDALTPHHDRFPPLFVELVAIGEQSGRLEDTFYELEEYYENSLSVQRDFRSQMAYPVIQFVAAVLVIALLIYVLGALGKDSDVLGVGLSGSGGAVLFVVIALGFVGAILFMFKLAANNVRWRARMEGLGLWLPGWGPALRAFAMQRFCVALRMTHEAGLSPQKALHYSFRATANAAFQTREDRAVEVVKKGRELTRALRASGAPFPVEFLEAMEVAEISGQVSEVMERLAESYREEAKRKMKQATQFTGYGVYALVALGIIFAIFTIAARYIGALNQAAG